MDDREEMERQIAKDLRDEAAKLEFEERLLAARVTLLRDIAASKSAIGASKANIRALNNELRSLQATVEYPPRAAEPGHV